MKKIGIIRCMQTEDICPGTTDFSFAAQGKGAFEELGPCEVIGFVSCGGCPGKRAVARARMLVDRGAEAVALASCICKGNPISFPCPHHETMIAADGVGLAGPQVGMMRRLFVVWDTTDAPEEIPEDYEYKFIDFVNPEILAVSEEEETAYEGCLSFPGHNGAVTRPVAVKVRAQDRNGEWFELEADGLLGRCIQHENDHLDGITIMESSEYFYEDTEEGKKAAREAKGNN